MMDELNAVQQVVVWILPIIFAVTGHEVAHGWVAKLLGDNTADEQGRLTLNPIQHIDILGSLIIPGLLKLTLTGFVFGWAKPVPVDPSHFKYPKRDMALVAAAGPLANLLMAAAWALLARLGVMLEIEFVSFPLIYSGVAGIHMNLMLAIINILPIPPLDGSKILAGFLPNYWAWQMYKLERFGLIILLLLFVFEAKGYTSILKHTFGYPMYYAQQWFFSLAGM